MISKHISLKTYLNKPKDVFFFIQLNDFTNIYVIRIILITINHLFAHSLMFLSISMYSQQFN